MVASKEKWFVAEDIPQNTPFMMSGACGFMVQEWPKHGLGGEVHEYFTLFEGDLGKMCYVRKEFDAQAEFLSSKILKDPEWALDIIAQIKTWSGNFFENAKGFRKLDFPSMEKSEMIVTYEKQLKHHILSHGFGASVSWHADHDKERVSKSIQKVIKKQLKKHNLDKSVAEVFSILSTPTEESFIKQEEKELLAIAASNDEKALKKHAKRYEWLNYQYKGPAHDFLYFKDRFDALVNGKSRPSQLLDEIIAQEESTKDKQKQLLRELDFDTYQLNPTD